MKILVCGGRNYNGDISCLDQLDISILIHGGCRGADLKAEQWAHSQGIHTACVSALWKKYGKSAGHKRNSIMLLLEPDLCVAFPGGNGTKGMIQLAKNANIPVWEPYETDLLEY